MEQLLEIIDNEIQQEGFAINNDEQAEWALLKLQQHKADLERMKILCNNMISKYQESLKNAEIKHEQDTSFLKSQLQQYFETIKPKETKTQAVYKLPSGTLKKKFGTIEYIRDDEKLLEWVKKGHWPGQYIKIKESVDWAELKKTVTVSGLNIITADGEIVEGVTAVEKPDKFEIEF